MPLPSAIALVIITADLHPP